jgi:hypothetical protein
MAIWGTHPSSLQWEIFKALPVFDHLVGISEVSSEAVAKFTSAIGTEF